MCLMALNAQAQTKFCNSYAEYKTNQWKPYADLIPEKEPDSIRVKYDGQDFTLKKKGDRQSAANILPILVKKGLIQDYHHKK